MFENVCEYIFTCPIHSLFGFKIIKFVSIFFFLLFYLSSYIVPKILGEKTPIGLQLHYITAIDKGDFCFLLSRLKCAMVTDLITLFLQ